MNLYFDEDSAHGKLVARLRQAGHRVLTAIEADMAGASDARHLTYATEHDLVLVTGNHDDFKDLHKLVQATRGTHPGLIIICSDNDPTKDMTPRGITSAIGKLARSGVPITNQCYILNYWR